MADPQLTAAWWDKNRPKTLPSTGFGKVLKTYEKELKEFETEVKKSQTKENVFQLHKEAKKALGDVKSGATLAANKCNKTLHKDAIKSLTTIMNKTTKDEEKRLDALFGHFQMAKKAHADDVKKTYDARDQAMQQFLKNAAAAKKAAEDFEKEHGALDKAVTGAGRVSNKTAALNAVDDVKKKLEKLKLNATNWRKSVEKLRAVKLPAVDMGKLDASEKPQFTAQSDKHDNAINDLGGLVNRVQVVSLGVDELVTKATKLEAGLSG